MSWLAPGAIVSHLIQSHLVCVLLLRHSWHLAQSAQNINNNKNSFFFFFVTVFKSLKINLMHYIELLKYIFFRKLSLILLKKKEKRNFLFQYSIVYNETHIDELIILKSSLSNAKQFFYFVIYLKIYILWGEAGV